MSEHDRRKEEVAEEITTLAQEAESAVDAQRDPTADALQSFADTIQEKTGAMPSDRATEAGAVAAEQIERTADFVHEHRPQQLAEEGQPVLWRQPAVAMVIGVVIGFVIGRLSK
jgi:ElaB/YqjD/DUF883 family membrane-anchored ribosome-binding protein